MFELKGKTALVTAASRGIGFSSACALASGGAAVYIAAPEKEITAVKETVQGCRDAGLDISMVQYDAFDQESYSPMIGEVYASAGKIDVLVNNFGYTDMKKDLDIRRISYADFEKYVTINLSSVMIPIISVLPEMEKHGGSIINISSIAASVPDMTEMAYGTAKAAICHITRMVAVQEARHHIRCNAVLPGLTNTDAVKRALSDEYKSFFLRHVPLKRAAEPDEIGAAVRYLASDEASFVTGQLLEVAGGFGLATPLYAESIDMIEKAGRKEQDK